MPYLLGTNAEVQEFINLFKVEGCVKPKLGSD